MIRFACEKCGAAVRVPDEHAGKQGRCPTCQAILIIPQAQAPPTPPVGAGPMRVPAGAPPPSTPPRRPAAPSSKALAICAVVFGALGIFPILGLVGVILAIIVLAGNKPGKGLAVTGLLLGFVLGTGSFVLGFIMLSRARETARQSVCSGNLNAIGRGLIMCVDIHGEYPRHLHQLVEDGSVAEATLRCPSARNGRECDYVYLKGRRSELAAEIVACDRKGNHDGVRNVLYANGRVAGMTEAEFRAELSEKSNKRFAEHLRRVEGQ